VTTSPPTGNYPYRKVSLQLGGVLLLSTIFFAVFIYRVPDPGGLFGAATHGTKKPLVSALAPSRTTTSTTQPTATPVTAAPVTNPTTTPTTFPEYRLGTDFQAKKPSVGHAPATLPGDLLLASGPLLTSTPTQKPTAPTTPTTRPVVTTPTTTAGGGGTSTTTTVPPTTTTVPPTTTTVPPTTTTVPPTTTTTTVPETTTTVPATTTTLILGLTRTK
jgi:hypothetical protein